MSRYVRAWVHRVDLFQRRHRPLAIAVAVARKFGEDQSTNLASMIAFWAFFSVFPLLLVFVTVLGFTLPPGIKGMVLTTVADLLPLLDVTTVQGFGGEWWALILGAVTALWSGLSVVRALQAALNTVWETPYVRYPSLINQVGRGLAVLATVGVGLVLSTLVNGYITGAAAHVDLSWYGRLVGYVVAIVLDVGLFVAAFRILTHQKVTTCDVLPGALLSGVAFFVLQTISSLIISRYLQSAQSTYGHFTTVITILFWFYLQSMITLFGAQLNVVLTKHLHPRSAVGGPHTEADRRAYDEYAKERTYHRDQRIHTDFPSDRADGTTDPETR